MDVFNSDIILFQDILNDFTKATNKFIHIYNFFFRKKTKNS